jgi:hypothetical protein
MLIFRGFEIELVVEAALAGCCVTRAALILGPMLTLASPTDQLAGGRRAPCTGRVWWVRLSGGQGARS